MAKKNKDTTSPNQGTSRRTWMLVIAAIAAAAGLAAVLGEVQRGQQQNAAFRIGGPFELTSHTGERFSSETLKGRPHMVFFGFTHCPDICPTTLQEVSSHMADLGTKADELLPLFISVDPARDTAENLKSYLESFDKRIVGLTGTEDEIKKVTKLYRAYYERIDGTDGEYSMNHTASVYLFDRRGNLTGTMSWQEKPEARQAKIDKALAR